MSTPTRTPLPLFRLAILFALALFAVGLHACDAGDQTLLEVDPGAITADPTFDMVQRIMDRSCVPCHNDAGGEDDSEEDDNENRWGLLAIAPLDDDRDYSSCFGILSDIQGILDTAVDEESMPPGAWPRLTEEEKLIITRWLDNGACAPCRPCE